MTLPTGNMMRAARALAGLKAAELAKLAGVDQSTISRLETFGRKTVAGHAGTVEAVVRVLRSRGVEITEDGGVRPVKRRART
jgi:transcriptional regulator with XRE-family HTH domain